MSSQSNLNYVSTIEGTDSSHCQASLSVSSASGSLRHYSLTDATQVCPLHGKLVESPSSTANTGKYLVCSVNCDKSKQTVKPTLHCPLSSCVASNPQVLSSYLGLPQGHCDDLMMLGPNEMLKFVRKAETETLRVTSGQNQTNRDLGRCFQNFQCEIRALRESNQRLSDDNQELRDLCCFLDDDRQKGRKLAREWQRFGRYTASVMRQEVAAYQKKLRELENKQQELIKDNLELKELCLYLDEERNQNLVCSSCGNHCRAVVRDDGDGSSSSTNADDLSLPSQFISGNHYRSEGRERLLEESIQRQRTVFNVQMMHYVRSLEQRMKQLEDEKKVFLQKLNETGKALPVNEYKSNNVWENDLGAFSGRPEAVVQALQVLEVREQLEQIQGSSQVAGMYDAGFPPVQHNEDEKVLMKETCNVCK